jgi:hypothetical protein
MESLHAPTPALGQFRPLARNICCDDFDTGYCGWVDLTPNFTLENFDARNSIVDKTQWGPIMLSSATFGYVGTHGSMRGTYSLKLATRPVAAPYEEPPRPGSMSHAIKRLSVDRPKGLRQIEMWYAYTPEQDRIGLSEQSIRAFGVFCDVQDADHRYFLGVRYLNSVNGKLKQQWQFMQAGDVTDDQWAYGTSGDWCKRGVDPMWYGRRNSDGSTDGFQFVADGHQQLCYNESDDKINWLYMRLLFDTAKREYVELQSGDRVWDLRGIRPTFVAPYARIRGLFNPGMWVENDEQRRVFMFVDSIAISAEN